MSAPAPRTSFARTGSPGSVAKNVVAGDVEAEGVALGRRVAKAATRSLLLVNALAAFALGGCLSRPDIWEEALRIGPFYQPVNFQAERVMPTEIRRVVVLPIFADRVAPEETTQMLDAALLEALQRAQRFEAVGMSREDCRRAFGVPELASTAALPHGALEELQRRFAADAVMFVDLTAYEPYQTQRIGFRAKLATVRDVRLVWSFDEQISLSDPAVRNSARRRYYRREYHAEPFDLSPAALQSPGWFAAFAADEMFRTLPPR